MNKATSSKVPFKPSNEKLMLLSFAVHDFIQNHHQRSDDPEFDALCEAYVLTFGKDPRE